MNKNFRSISSKLVFILSFSALIAILMTSVGLFWYKYNQSKEQATDTLSQIVGIMSENIIASIEFDDVESAKTILAALKSSKNIDFAYVVKDSNTTFASYRRDGVDEKELKSKIASIYTKSNIKKEIHYVDFNDIIVSKPIYYKDRYLASFVVASNTKGINRALIDQLYVQLITSALVFVVMLLLAFKLQRIFTTPIFRLKEAMDDVRIRGDYDARVYFQSNDEFQSLIDGFDKMLETIKKQSLELERHADMLNETIKIKTADIEKQKDELESLLATIDKNVIFSRTDVEGNIVQASDAFCLISGYSKEELMGRQHNILRHQDTPKAVFEDLWKTIKSGGTWKGEVKNRKKDGGFYWVSAIVTPEYDADGHLSGYSAIRQDITAKKEAEELNIKQQEQLLEIQRFQSLTAGREARMVELKEAINKLSAEHNLPIPFKHLDETQIAVEDSDAYGKIQLLDVIDIASLQKLLDYFCNSVEIASAIIDIDGNILAASRWQKACTDFHRKNEQSCANCIESDIDLSRKLQNKENYSIYKCKNGLVDCACPIVIDNQHVANVFIGQFLTSKPDLDYFKKQAELFGYEMDGYIGAIEQVPVIDEQKLPNILGFLSGFTELISSLSLEKIKAKKAEYVNHETKIAALNLAEDANSAKNELIKHQEHLEELISDRTADLNDERNFVNSVMNSQNNIVISTDGTSLKTANKALFDFYEISSVDEFLSKFGNCICDTFKTDAPEGFLQKMTSNQKWIDFVCDNPQKIHKAMIERNGVCHSFTVTADRFMFKDEELSVAVFNDITELEKIREEVERILENILLPVLITSKKERKILYANKYAETQYEKPISELIGSDIDDIYTMKDQYRHIIDTLNKYGKVENMEEVFKTSSGKEFPALLSVTPIYYNNADAYIGMVTDITKQKNAENEIRVLHKHTKESIEYASLIQHSLIPPSDEIRAHFAEYFVIWHPKDIVGGDIYFFENFSEGEECILFVIDCTGHGVAGAFVTMLVKAIERQITSNIKLKDGIVSPAKMLSVFNKSMKSLLKQENDDAISNAGFDGAIIYHNKKSGVLKFAGAHIPLFYVEDGELKTIKGDRQSIGYKKSDGNFEFSEHTIKTKEGMCFYVTTDGYLDQNGGEKGFPFGKKKFSAMIEQNYMESFADQQEIFIDALYEHQKDEMRNDDITLIGFRI